MLGGIILKETKAVQWMDYLWLSLYAFLGLGLEIVLVYLIEPIIFNVDLSKYSTAKIIYHWIATIILWGIMAFILSKVSKKKYGFDYWDYQEKMNQKDWIITLFLVLVSIGISIWNWSGWKVYKELHNLGWLKFTFQYLYYLMETVLIVLIIVFSQKAGELKFSKSNIPWGGILVGLTWGLAHALTKGNLNAGILSFFSGLLYGVVYLLVKKNIRIAYPLIACMFIL
mgnify:CR=1 FL=1